MSRNASLRRHLGAMTLWLLVTGLLSGSQDPKSPETLRKLISAGRYDDAEREARTLLAEAEATHGRDSLEAAKILDYLVEALSRVGKSRIPESQEFADRLVKIKEKIFGPDHVEVAASLNGMGLILLDIGNYQGAASAHRRALAIREKALGPEHGDVALSLHNLATALKDAGEYVEARSLYDRAISIKEKTFGPDRPTVANSVNSLANLLRDTGDYVGARSLYERALAIREKALGPDHPSVATTLNSLANLLAVMAEFGAARSLYERALSINEKALGPDHPNLGNNLNNLANVLQQMGDYAGAKPLYERTLALREKALGPDHPAVGQTLNNLALLLKATGDYARARSLHERDIGLKEKALGPAHPDVADSLNNLGNLLVTTGDYAGARSCFDRALATREKVLGPNHSKVAQTLDNIGSLLRNSGDHAGARSFYERALAIREKALGPNHPDVAANLNNIGELLELTGDFAQARPILERALEIKTKSFGPDHPILTSTLNVLAELRRGTGDYAGARLLLERSVAIVEKAFGPDHPELVESLAGMARLLADTGEIDGAFAAALRAETIGREHFRLTARTLSEQQALSYASVRFSGLDLAFSLGPGRLPSASRRKAWDALIRSRALILDEMAARHRTVRGATEITRLSEAVAAAQLRLANLTVRGPGQEPVETHRRLLDRARQEKEQAERALAERSVSFQDEQATSRVGLAEVTSALPKGSTLVGFARYNHDGVSRSSRESSSAARAPKKSGSSPHYLAFVLRSGEDDPTMVSLGSAREIETLIADWSKEAARGAILSGRSAKQSETAYRRAGAALRSKIWDPITAHLGEMKRVFVVPDGALNLVTLAALPVGETDYLIEQERLLHYLSAERDLLISSRRPARGKGLLALGGAAFDQVDLLTARPSGPDVPAANGRLALNRFRGEQSSCSDFQSIRFHPLPSTGREVEELIGLWTRRSGRPGAITAQDVSDVVHLTGSKASEAMLKHEAPGRRVLHLATHGFFIAGRCPSALQASRGIGGLVTSEESRSKPMVGENPLVLAGLALAGANHRTAVGPEQEDGILTAEEIASMDLASAEWAVLSACDTGVGEIRAGEGVFGLRRAFQIAGVGALIMSLWSVDDEGSRRWMAELYEERLLKGLGTAEAVREASLKMLRDRRKKSQSTHPFYWASFIAAGDWR